MRAFRSIRRRAPSLLLTACLALSMAGTLAAQAPAAGEEDPAARFPGFAPQAGVEAFLRDAGPGWRATWDHARGVPALVFGGNRAAVSGPRNDADFDRAARAVVDELAPALGYTSRQLRTERVKRLALSRIGSSDKVVVKLTQSVDGIDTHQGHVNVLFSAEGRLLAVDNGGLPHVRETLLSPLLDLDGAGRIAAEAFVAAHRLPLERVDLDAYVIFPAVQDAGRSRRVVATPAYVLEVWAVTNPAAGELPVGRAYAVAARGAPRVLDSWSLVHEADLTGSVAGWGQPGLLPDGADPDVLLDLEGVRLTTAGEADVFTDGSGAFTFPGVNSAQTVTATLDGPFAQVFNDAGAEAQIALSVAPGSPESFVFNAGLTEHETAQVNAFKAIHDFRNWLTAVDPSETIFDFPAVAIVNVADTCNAVFQGTQMVFFLSDIECVNSAYSTVVYHEQGHWANQLFGFGNSSTGIGEGGADIWAMYIADDPLVGDGFKGPGTIIRSGLNTTPFCGDTAISCYGESHANGQPLMGAAWKLRQRLKDDFGDTPGADIANLLMVSWYQTFNDNILLSTIEEHWLLLDDDNGDIDDGTPHYTQIDGGFRDNSWPGFDLPRVTISHSVDDLVNHEGDVDIEADIVETLGTIDFADVVYSTDDGQNWATAPLAPAAGDTWAGEIPGQASPETVRYFIQVQATDGAVDTLPRRASGDYFLYDVGVRTTHAFFDFEGVDDEGWSHLEIATQDDWQRGTPSGRSSDPSGAYSGSNVWANDLGLDNFNGAYQPNVINALTSPPFDLASATNTRLRFRRWLSVEKSEFDFAEILVDGVQAWVNPFAEDVMDRVWTPVDLDIAALADGDASVEIAFQLTTDAGLEVGGWTIDDFELVSLAPVVDSDFISYGVGTTGFGGLAPTLSGAGQAVPGGPVTLSLTNARPSAVGALFIGTDQVLLEAFGGDFLIDPILGFFLLITDGSGELTLPGSIPNNPALSGFQVTLQHWLVDPDATHGYAGSNGLMILIGS